MKKSEINQIIESMNLNLNENSEYLINIHMKREFEEKIQKELKIDSKDSKKFILSFKDSEDKRIININSDYFNFIIQLIEILK